MEILMGLFTALLGGTVWEGCRALFIASGERNGTLAGHWYQVTYDPDDEGRIWSIEWVEVKHRKGSVSGTMWRVYSRNFDRRWKFEGRYLDSFVISSYWADRGDGKNGSMLLYRHNHSGCIGRFMQAQPRNIDFNLRHDGFSAHVEWIRLGSDSEVLVLGVLSDVDREQLRHHLPARIYKRLVRQLALEAEPSEFWRSLSYGSALVDLSGPLAAEEERRRLRDGGDGDRD
ncbi:hypothetical protein ACFVYF_21355 [Streptomyces sp. NPDC058274]|uniref:hypothetical protein n=1 Tax=Streptomyces sp. NPDC058274 TaxID=3346416 RepID=UPI0036E7D699